jgi:acetylornithine/succinyldiaminopimelate/putrescine aminotransferase
LSQISTRTAAVFFEPVGGEIGSLPTEQQFIQALRNRCKETGTLLIFDEVQSGFGRTGRFWSFEHYGIVPDMVLCAKGMGGGMPIGAFIAPSEIMAVFKENPILGHITTFGGHPVSSAASLATLQVIHEEKLLEQVAAKEQLIRDLLIHPKIKRINGKGFMLAAEMESFEVLKPVIDRAIQLGVITDWYLYCDNSMRIAPPLTITEAEIRTACRLILEALDC